MVATSTQGQDLRKQLQAMEDTLLCLVCMERQKNTVFLCGHALCKQCSDSLQVCPMCRKSITKRIQLYSWYWGIFDSKKNPSLFVIWKNDEFISDKRHEQQCLESVWKSITKRIQLYSWYQGIFPPSKIQVFSWYQKKKDEFMNFLKKYIRNGCLTSRSTTKGLLVFFLRRGKDIRVLCFYE